MMIRHNQIHAPVFGYFRWLDGSDAAVDGDDELGAVVAELGDRFGIQAVSFVDAVGGVEVGSATEGADGVPENRGGGDAVDVVVAVKDDPLVVADRAGDAIGGAGEAGYCFGVVETLEAGP